jgi:hypothetical protein
MCNLEAIEKKLDEMEAKIDQMDVKIDQMDAKIDQMIGDKSETASAVSVNVGQQPQPLQPALLAPPGLAAGPLRKDLTRDGFPETKNPSDEDWDTYYSKPPVMLRFDAQWGVWSERPICKQKTF